MDFRALNEVTCKSSYLLPRKDKVLNESGKAQWFSKLDLKAGYWQIVLDPEDRHKTALVTHDSLFEFLADAFWFDFGTCNIPMSYGHSAI